MRPWLKTSWRFARYCADCVGLLVCWALWIVLGGMLAAQIGIALSREFAVPAFVLRSIEERFTASQVNVRFGRATFDPTGGVLLEDVSVSLPEFAEPVIDADAVLIELNPWLLLGGKVEAARVHATGVTLSIPAMLAPSGRSEAVLSELDLTLTPGTKQIEIEHLSARIAGVAVSLKGEFHPMGKRPTEADKSIPVIETLAQQYPQICRQLIRAAEQLSVFEEPQLQATLTPSAERGAIADVQLIARALKLPRFRDLEVRELSATLKSPLSGNTPATVSVTIAASELRIGTGETVRNLQAALTGALNTAHFSFSPTKADITADEVRAHGFSAQSVTARIQPPSGVDHPASWSGEIVLSAAGSPLSIHGKANVAEKIAAFEIHGAFAPSLLEPIGAKIGRDVRPFINFGKPVELDLHVDLQPGWKFARVSGDIAARQIAAYRVPIDSASGHIDFDGRHFIARDAVARLGENRAWGSFEQDLTTKKFRFLLDGQLRPLDISGWFGPWWPGFFQHFEFPTRPPDASVDVAGRWMAGHETTVFVFAETRSPIIRGTPLDYGRTLMFIRPTFFDGLEFVGRQEAGQVRGTFTRWLDPEKREWTRMIFDVDSTLDLATGGGLIGPELTKQLAPFTFANAPHVKASGRLEGPAAPDGEHQKMQIQARSTGTFTVYDFPAQSISFVASINDDELSLSHIEADVANGKLTGTARIWGGESTRKIGFDVNVHGGLLGEAVTLVSNYSAHRRGQPAAAAANLLPGKNQVKFDLAIAAEGNFDDLLSYHGKGNALLFGAGLGEVRLLGLLSELLDFTALRFTDARLDFQLEGRDVVFPSLTVTGASSAIEGHGDYSLERGEMDFNARVYPFQESKSILQNMVGVVLLPLSTMLEVKLTGPLQQPKWAFVMGPTNFFRSITQPTRAEESGHETDAPSAYLKR